jgi:hypothetical protein
LPVFPIPLVEMLYLVIGTNLQDRILIAKNLTELCINFDLWSNWPWEHYTGYSRHTPMWRLNLYFHHKALNRACTSKGRAFFDPRIINTYYLEGSYKSKFKKTIIVEKSQCRCQIGHCGCTAQPLYKCSGGYANCTIAPRAPSKKG